MITINEEALVDRFIKYAQVDTQSDPLSAAHPTTQKQKDLAGYC